MNILTSPSHPALFDSAVHILRETVQGDVLTPEDDGYEPARRVWNGVIDRYPALIARCATNEDVVACVRFARAHDVPLAVRGGGHNVAGSAVCNGGLVIDLSPMKEVRVHRHCRRAFAQAGVTIGELDRATQKYGLAAPMGVVSQTGIAGLTLGGGLGWMARKHGLSCDALCSVEVVTADGRLLHADETENADLFWAVRGGGGNFGIVTRFEFELFDVGPEVYFAAVFYPISVARHVVRSVRSFMATAPEEVGVIAVLTHVPPFEILPKSYHGDPCVILVATFIGDVDEGRRELAPLRELAEPIADLSGPSPYLEVQQFFDDDYPDGERHYWKSVNLTSLEDEAIERLLEMNDIAPSPHSTVDIGFPGGAMGRVAPDATAFGDRTSPIMIAIEANWHDAEDDEANVLWARWCFETLKPFSEGRMYLNFPGFDGDSADHMQATYGANFERLVALKRKYDPDNVFRTHQNIQPSDADLVAV